MAWNDDTIESERLRLRAVAERDRPTVVALLTDPDVRRYLGGPVELPEDFSSHPLGQQPGVWGIEVKDYSTITGTVALHDERRGKPELSYNLLPTAWGHGYAEEACRAVLDWFWSDSATGDEVIAVTQRANAPSLRLLRRLGFTETERFEEFGDEQSFQTVGRPAEGLALS